jgi:uncharacterized protein YjbJ (UPF0337 family)
MATTDQPRNDTQLAKGKVKEATGRITGKVRARP